jgi:hypothetical protein
MRVKWVIAAYLLAATPVLALDLPLSHDYGTEAGCLQAAGQHGEGDEIVFTKNAVRFEGIQCPYTAVKDVTNEAGLPALEVTIRCASGHDEELPGTLQLTEDTAAQTLAVLKIDGEGPESGDLPACSAVQ